MLNVLIFLTPYKWRVNITLLSCILSQKNIHKETGLGLQLQKILENFVSNQWENLNNSYVAKECLWKPRSKSLALSDFCSDHARLEAKEEAKEEDTRECREMSPGF